MNGPEHYAKAERLITPHVLEDAETLKSFTHLPTAQDVALAQVHATLALAAATAMNGIGQMDEDDFREWDKVAGVQRDGE